MRMLHLSQLTPFTASLLTPRPSISVSPRPTHTNFDIWSGYAIALAADPAGRAMK